MRVKVKIHQMIVIVTRTSYFVKLSVMRKPSLMLKLYLSYPCGRDNCNNAMPKLTNEDIFIFASRHVELLPLIA